jgi:hypothetical protein
VAAVYNHRETGDFLMAVVWDDGDGKEIIYPVDATYLRKAMPWE